MLFFISINDHRSRNRFHHPSSFRSLQKRELLYLSPQMIWHTTENGISAQHRILSIFLFLSSCLCVSVSLLLPSILVNRNRRFCGNDNTRQWNRTRSRKRTNCWDNNYSRNWPRAGRDRWGRERDRLSFVCVSGVIIDTSCRTLFSWSFVNIPGVHSLELKSRSTPMLPLPPFNFRSY